MTYDSPLWASDGWVILEVASFEEEDLVTPEGWEWEKGKLKICCSKGELNPGLLHEIYEIKAHILPILHSTRLKWLIMLELTYYYRTLSPSSHFYSIFCSFWSSFIISDFDVKKAIGYGLIDRGFKSWPCHIFFIFLSQKHS